MGMNCEPKSNRKLIILHYNYPIELLLMCPGGVARQASRPFEYLRGKPKIPGSNPGRGITFSKTGVSKLGEISIVDGVTIYEE